MLIDLGVWLRPFGPLVYTMPPFVMGDDDLDILTTAMVATASSIS